MHKCEDEIIRKLQQISGKYPVHEVFADWVRCIALSISNSMQMVHDSIWQEREQLYNDTISKYTDKEQLDLHEMLALLCETLEEDIRDVLGEVYMKAGGSSKVIGQFFTPFDLSELCAALGLTDVKEEIEIPMNEPACGSGGMVIAAAKILKDKGLNYQNMLRVVAQDLEWRCVYMCYVQLSLLGIDAICIQGNTLAEPYDPARTQRSHILLTPKRMGVLL